MTSVREAEHMRAYNRRHGVRRSDAIWRAYNAYGRSGWSRWGYADLREKIVEWFAAGEAKPEQSDD